MVLQWLFTIWWSLCRSYFYSILRMKSLKMEPVNGLVIYKNFTCPQGTIPVCEKTQDSREHPNEGLLAWGLCLHHRWAAMNETPAAPFWRVHRWWVRSHCQNVVVSRPCFLNLIVEVQTFVYISVSVHDYCASSHGGSPSDGSLRFNWNQIRGSLQDYMSFSLTSESFGLHCKGPWCLLSISQSSNLPYKL